MPDDRSLEEKLEAMSRQTVASPIEAEIATAFLAKMRPRRQAEFAQRHGLRREAILATADRTDVDAREVQVRMPSGMWLVMRADEVDWEEVRAHHLRVKR